MTTQTVVLESAPMVHTPGIVRWAINGYKFLEDRPRLLNVFTKGFNLTKKAAHALLSGEAQHKIIDDKVIFNFNGKALKKA